MAAMTDFLENKLIDFLFRGQALGITGATAAAVAAAQNRGALSRHSSTSPRPG